MILLIASILLIPLAIRFKYQRELIIGLMILLLSITFIATLSNMDMYKKLRQEKTEIECIKVISKDGKDTYIKVISNHNKQCDAQWDNIIIDISKPFRKYNFKDLKINKTPDFK